MTRSSKWLSATLLFLVSLLPSALRANSVGQAVDVSQNAFLDRNGNKGYLEQGGEVVLGDVITTGATGQVQILFQDGTKIAISQNSSLVIERILFNSSGTAKEFTVNAVGGAFRFLSGNSNSSAYSIRTSQATMGIRGTEFDFAASPRGAVQVATFSGEVELCSRSGQCVRIPGGCSVAALDNSGQFITPQNRRERSALLKDGFPYIKNQDGLRRDYRTRTGSCSSGGAAAAPDSNGRPGRQAPSPSPGPSNPGVGGAQAGGNSSAGSGGSTAGSTSAGQGGPSGPGDADASGGQASAGGSGGASAGGGSAGAGGSGK